MGSRLQKCKIILGAIFGHEQWSRILSCFHHHKPTGCSPKVGWVMEVCTWQDRLLCQHYRVPSLLLPTSWPPVHTPPTLPIGLSSKICSQYTGQYTGSKIIFCSLWASSSHFPRQADNISRLQNDMVVPPLSHPPPPHMGKLVGQKEELTNKNMLVFRWICHGSDLIQK